MLNVDAISLSEKKLHSGLVHGSNGDYGAVSDGCGVHQLAVLAGDFLLAKAAIGLSTLRNGEVRTFPEHIPLAMLNFSG